MTSIPPPARTEDADALLRAVADLEPPAHALIDSGALCVGMSNLAVAQRLLRLLRHVDGVGGALGSMASA